MTAPPIIDGVWFQALAITNRVCKSSIRKRITRLQYSMEELVFEQQAAAEYDRAFGHVTRYFMPFVLRAARIARGMRVLDIEKAGFQPNAPLFQTFRKKKPTGRAMSRSEAYRMIPRRAIDAGVFAPVCCHSFRATGITVYLENKGTLETAQKIAAHESPRTTKLYDRTDDQLTLDEIEEISV
jgi:hypothetical protein